MNTSGISTAIVMPAGTQLLVGPFQSYVRAALRAYDGDSGEAPLILPGRGMIAGDGLVVQIKCDPSALHAPRVVFTVYAHDKAASRDTTRMMQVLGEIVLNALDNTNAVEIEWLSPEQKIPAEDFAEIATYELPHDLPEMAQAPGAPSPEAVDLRLKIASWAMALVIGLLSLPVAATVMIIGAARGLNLRLTTHALTLTAVGAVLHVSGVLSGPFTQALF
ncbi:hypothetical protein [Aestuariicoccus sp. MJ-SS9]|uniref:hypothetical protein n=1 Tax=Aestuariicoccus sp. MJ-SS9 TaxID=3079855 RepID=UPI002906030F|nr:hypothetical protein [Aestuariicoccus sp. MJ-SS9]MDU8913615.1 hypothetical protein [Aestuariicoccus sp. MJ-SS9]